MSRKARAAIVLALILAGCGTKASVGGTVTDTPAAATSTPGDVPQGTPADNATSTQGVGDVVRISCDGVDCLDVTVSQVKFAAKYGSGYSTDVPERKGNVFAAVEVRYKAIVSGADYNLWDWQLFVRDEAVSDFASVFYGPSPELSAGTLPKGKSVSGWLFWEVPKSGRVTIAYGGSASQAPVFEVVLRK